jgi:hypothetical protein
MNKIKEEYEKFISLTKTHDDWKSIDISRINLNKFFKNTYNILCSDKEILSEEESNQIIIKNNYVKNNLQNKNIAVLYDTKKLFKNIKKNKKINDKVENYNYLFSPYFININIEDGTQTQSV